MNDEIIEVENRELRDSLVTHKHFEEVGSCGENWDYRKRYYLYGDTNKLSQRERAGVISDDDTPWERRDLIIKEKGRFAPFTKSKYLRRLSEKNGKTRKTEERSARTNYRC